MMARNTHGMYWAAPCTIPNRVCSTMRPRSVLCSVDERKNKNSAAVGNRTSGTSVPSRTGDRLMPLDCSYQTRICRSHCACRSCHRPRESPTQTKGQSQKTKRTIFRISPKHRSSRARGSMHHRPRRGLGSASNAKRHRPRRAYHRHPNSARIYNPRHSRTGQAKILWALCNSRNTHIGECLGSHESARWGIGNPCISDCDAWPNDSVVDRMTNAVEAAAMEQRIFMGVSFHERDFL